MSILYFSHFRVCPSVHGSWSELSTQQFALEKPATGYNLDQLMRLPQSPPSKDEGNPPTKHRIVVFQPNICSWSDSNWFQRFEGRVNWSKVSQRYRNHTHCVYISKGSLFNQTWGISISTTSSSRASRWRKFQKKKELYSKERICLSNVRKMTVHCDVQTFFFGLNEAFAVAWLWCHALWGDVFVIWLAFKWCG